MNTINALVIQDITEKLVAIVKFGPAGAASDGMRPGEYFQVTIDPTCVSPSGKFIRFGSCQGDEILGWQRAESITIIEVLGSWGADGEPPVLHYGKSGVVSMPALTPLEK